MQSVFAIAVATTESATTGTTHDVVHPAMTVPVVDLADVSGMMPATPRSVTTAAPSTRPPAASAMGLTPSLSAEPLQQVRRHHEVARGANRRGQSPADADQVDRHRPLRRTHHVTVVEEILGRRLATFGDGWRY